MREEGGGQCVQERLISLGNKLKISLIMFY